MANNVIVTKNFNLKALVEKALEKKYDAANLAMSDQVTKIKARTTSGKDLNGKTFKKYSKNYAIIREKEKRQVSPPNLTRSGDMRRSLRREDAKKSGDLFTVKIGFTRDIEEKKMLGNKDKGREFFGISDKEAKQIIKRIEKA